MMRVWRDGGLRKRALGVLAAALGASVAFDPGSAATVCGGETIGTAYVAAIVDGRTFTLADGREVRLAALEVPPMARVADVAPETAGLAAKNALAELIGGRPVILQRQGAATDRYGRIVAHASVVRDGTAHLVAHDLIAAGHARVGARGGERDCTRSLLAAEETARAAKRGLWADPRYFAKQAEAPAEILAERGHFTLVEGKVLSVRESGGTIYINFGRRWSRDFAVAMPRRNETAFAAGGIEPKKLTGRRIRVRGWIEARGGPRIYATRPEQIELMEPQASMQAGPQ